VELVDQFEVEADPAEVWALLIDLERVVPLLPGAELEGRVDAETVKGRVQANLGPVRLSFAGTVQFEERDAVQRRARLRVRANEARGKGVAQATVTSHVQPSERGARVDLITDLHLSGAVAQYGGGLLAGVAKRLTAQFAENLAAALRGAAPAPSAPLSGLRLAADALGEAARGALASRRGER
jgi:carbon monoxide dehydrogenase subunit G